MVYRLPKYSLMKIPMRSISIIILSLLFQFTGTLSAQYEFRESLEKHDHDTKQMLIQNFHFSFAYQDYPEIHEQLLSARQLSIQGKSDVSFTQLESLLEKCREMNFGYAIADIELFIGEIYYNWGEYEKALKKFLNARAYAKDLHYHTTEAASLNYIGKYYHTTGNFDRSLRFFTTGLKIALNTSDSATISELYRNIGNYYNTTGSHSLALESLYNSLRFVNESNNPADYASSCNHLGNVYQDQGNLEKALKYHKDALRIRKTTDNKDDIGKSLKNLGEVYEEFNRSDTSVILYKQALDLFTETAYKKGIIKVSNNLGRIYTHQTHSEEGKKLLQNALKLSYESGYTKGIVNAHLELGYYHILSGNESEGIRNYNKALTQAKRYGLTEIEQEVYYRFYLIMSEKHDYKKALEYHILYKKLSDSVRDSEHLSHIEELAVRYETRVKERQNTYLKNENELQKTALHRKNIILWITVGAIFSLLVSVFSIFFSLKNKKKDNERLKILNHELNQANTEKDKLYSVIVHELRNPLLWFRNITRMLNRNFSTMNENEIKKSLISLDDSATHAYHLMDNLLQWTRSQLGKIDVKPEYFEIDQLILDNIKFAKNALEFKHIKINYTGENTTLLADRVMMNTVIRNLISNAIKFTPGNGKISIHTSVHGESLFLKVHDTGIGIKDADQHKIFDPGKKFSTNGILNEKGAGLGLLLSKEFIEKNDGILSFKSTENKGTEFVIQIPLPGKNHQAAG